MPGAGEHTPDLEWSFQEAARSVLAREIRQRDLEVDLSELRLLRVATLDLDGDGELEHCVIAGLQQAWGIAACLLFDPPIGPIEVVPFGEGFSDLTATDLDGDGLAEVILEWRLGSGALLTTGIFHWDGVGIRWMLQGDPTYQGLREMKDVDGDGRDELLLWQSLPDSGANWEPHQYRIHTYQLAEGRYVERGASVTHHRYYPASIVSQRVGLFGLPLDPSDRSRTPDSRKQEIAARILAGKLDVDYVSELGAEANRLGQERHLADALALYDLTLTAAGLLPAGPPRDRVTLIAWWQRGFTLSLLGDAEAAVTSYEKALDVWSGETIPEVSALTRPTLVREFGVVCAFAGRYDQALEAYAVARRLLTEAEAAPAEKSNEESRLESNLGITHLLIGDLDSAREHLQLATKIDRGLGRHTGLAINSMGLGNVERAAGRLEDASRTYRQALDALADPSDRDREADIYLELGMTLVQLGQVMEGLRHLHTALVLTSEDNLKQQGAKHYLHLADGHRAAGQSKTASAYYRRVLDATAGLETIDTRWQGFLGLALLTDGAERERLLIASVDAVERARPAYLPGSIPPTYLALGRERPYVELVRLHLAAAEDAAGQLRAERLGAAFEVVERARSRSYLTRLAVSGLRPSDDVAPALLARESRLLTAVRDLERRSQDEAAEDPRGHFTRLVETRRELDAVWDEMSVTSARAAEYVALRRGRPATLPQIRDSLTG